MICHIAYLFCFLGFVDGFFFFTMFIFGWNEVLPIMSIAFNTDVKAGEKKVSSGRYVVQVRGFWQKKKILYWCIQWFKQGFNDIWGTFFSSSAGFKFRSGSSHWQKPGGESDSHHTAQEP